jgi:hypothetical protein
MPKFEIDAFQIQFIDHENDNKFTYFMGFDQGDDWTSPETELSEENDTLIKEIRKLCYGN